MNLPPDISEHLAAIFRDACENPAYRELFLRTLSRSPIIPVPAGAKERTWERLEPELEGARS